MIRQGRGKEPAGLRLFPKGDKYRHLDSIIRSSRIVCGAYAIRPYKRGSAPRPFSPFLSLMKEKEAKENQGVRDASQIYRVRDVSMWCTRPFFPAPAGAVRDASQICRVLAGDVRDTDPIRHIRSIFPGLGRGLDLLLPSFLLSREEKKVLADLCLSPVGAICGAYAFAPYKRGCALTPPAGAACALCPLTVLCDPLYKCAGRLRVLVGWGRGVMGRAWGLNGLHIIY